MGDLMGRRSCDFCGGATALIHCRADSAKLCLACDRVVHSTNALFAKHTRTQLCNACDKCPVTILCSDEDVVLCQNCDCDTHGDKSDMSSVVHDRKVLEGFSGCPKVCELMVVFGLEDLGKKCLMESGEESEREGFDQCRSGGGNGFSDYLVWDTPAVFNLDDLIGGLDSSCGFSASEAPHIPKVVKATCGKHKEEILRQLREMPKSEPGFGYEDVDPLIRFNVDDHVLQPRDVLVDCEHDETPIIRESCKEKALSLSKDSNKRKPGMYLFPISKPDNEYGIVPEKPSGNPNQLIDSVIVPNKTEILPYVSKVHSYQYNSQERDIALSRYKKKKENRRYDKHIRYESRKARAESRIRIKGRFAKSTDQ